MPAPEGQPQSIYRLIKGILESDQTLYMIGEIKEAVCVGGFSDLWQLEEWIVLAFTPQPHDTFTEPHELQNLLDRLKRMFPEDKLVKEQQYRSSQYSKLISVGSLEYHEVVGHTLRSISHEVVAEDEDFENSHDIESFTAKVTRPLPLIRSVRVVPYPNSAIGELMIHYERNRDLFDARNGISSLRWNTIVSAIISDARRGLPLEKYLQPRKT